VVVLVDRSGSMGARTPDGATRWGAVRTALSRTLPLLNDALDLGLNVFPIDNGCGVNSGMITVPVRTSNAVAVNTVLGYFAPGGNTPTQSALQATLAWLMANSSTLPRYVILATDGEPTCGQRLGAVTDQLMAMNASGTPTFVLGIPGTSASLRSALQQMALAGGRPRSGPNAWYEANDTMELVTAVRAIAATGTECTNQDTLTVATPALHRVQINGTEVPMDAANGWTFVGGSVQFHGESCTRLRTGSVINITALYNCS
jgi:hypothetical protein